MATNEWKDRAADAARQAAERTETGGASVAAGGAKEPDDARVPGVPGQAPDRVAGTPGDRMPRDGPEPEEVPELLGERSDYPAPRGEGEE